MKDFSKLSNEELYKIAGIQPANVPTMPQPEANVQRAPATDFSKLSDEELAKIAGVDIKPKVVNEMHPDLTFKDRLIVKNLATDQPGVAIDYLKKQHPNLEFKDSEGEIIAKRPEEKEWRPLDPKGFDIQDITDVGADIAGGVATTAGTALGALAGAPTGIGAIPAGMAAGAATGAGVETARQYLGKLAGLNQDISGQDVAIAGATGAVAPLLGGFGTTASKLAAKGASQGVARFAEKGALPLAGEFAYGKIKNAAGKLPEMLSGVKTEEYLRYLKNPERMAEIAAKGEENVASDVMTSVGQAVADERQAVGKEIQQKVRESGKAIDLSKLKYQLDSEIVGLESKSSRSQMNDSKLANLMDLRDKLFTRTVEGRPVGIDPTNVEVADTFDMKDILKAQADNFRGRTATKSGAENYLEGLAGRLHKEIDQQVENVIQERGNLAKRYKETLNAEALLRKKFGIGGNPDTQLEKALGTLDAIDSRKNTSLKSMLERLDQKYGTNVLETANDLRAYRYLENPSTSPISRGGTTSTSRTNIGKILGGAVGGAIGGTVSPEDSKRTGLIIGGGLGAVAGSTLASPASLKYLIKAGLNAEKNVARASAKINKPGLKQVLRYPINRELTRSTWEKLLGEKQ